jgi:uncharacterized protein (DUF885 family)
MRPLWFTILSTASAAASLAACSDDGETRVPPPRTVAPSPTEGVDSDALAALLVEHWDIEAAVDPLGATFIGDHRFDDQLPPIARADVAALRARRHALLDQAIGLDPGTLSARDRLTHGILVERLGATAALDVCDYERWALSPRDNMIGHLEAIGSFHPLLAREDADSYRGRVEAMPAAIDALASELAAGAAEGMTMGRLALQGMIGNLRNRSGRAPADWPMIEAIRDGYLDSAERDRLIRDVSAVITGQLVPAYRRLATTLEGTVLPAARDVEGLAGLPAGPDCYAAEIRHHTTLEVTAAELHDLGLAEVARIEAEILDLGRTLYGVDTLTAVRGRLETDPSQGFRSEAEILTWVQGIIDHARSEVAPLFARFPAAPLEIVPYPPEFGQVAASYRSSPDGIQPARYFLVTQPPERQARWALESTTYHEAIPGHHLQVGRGRELGGQPALRRAFTDTAYVEGWGLYAETLAGEIGLFTDGPARLGRLANEALRACRLVVDTGLHDLGWTRAEAITFMEQHSLFTGPFVAGEIERYLGWPGQALAYKVGELELLRVRGELEARDAAAFSLRDFHEAVLAEGSLPLPILAEHLLGAPGAPRRHRSAAQLSEHAARPLRPR